MCLFRQNGINELKGQNPRDNKRAGENKNKQRGQNIEKMINEPALSFDT